MKMDKRRKFLRKFPGFL